MAPSPPARRVSAAHRLRRQIEQAEAAGASRDEMCLQLTLSDADHLKRDRTLAIADLSFVGGEMRYLGVRIVQGGVAASVLDIRPAE
jgi:hypothetical protein